MTDKVYVILYRDGAVGVFNKRMERHDFFPGTRQFECDDDLPVIELCEWQGKSYCHRKIKEVGFETKG